MLRKFENSLSEADWNKDMGRFEDERGFLEDCEKMILEMQQDLNEMNNQLHEYNEIREQKI